jgi:hypothetical protein
MITFADVYLVDNLALSSGPFLGTVSKADKPLKIEKLASPWLCKITASASGRSSTNFQHHMSKLDAEHTMLEWRSCC